MPAVLNSYEQMVLLKQPNPKAPTGLRNLCIISLMLKLGLRVSEVINLKDSDIDWSRGRLHVRESGAAQERILWLDPAELNILKGWLNIKPAGSSYLFCTLDGGKLKDRYIREMIKRLSSKAGINKDVYPHLLRYTFAVDFMREVKDISLLQEALGHRDSAATQAYAKLLFEDIKGPGINEDNYKRSGMPVSSGQQQSLDFIYTKRNTSDMISNSANATKPKIAVDACPDKSILNEGEGGIEKMKDQQSQPGSSCPDDNKPSREELSKDNTAPVDDNHIQDRSSANVYDNVNEPKVTITTEKSDTDRIKIPPIKCSQCNYILRYQGDCPRCGASFNAILRHWGKNV